MEARERNNGMGWEVLLLTLVGCAPAKVPPDRPTPTPSVRQEQELATPAAVPAVAPSGCPAPPPLEADDECSFWVRPESSKRPGSGQHKVRINMPDAMAGDEAIRARVAAEVVGVGALVLLNEGMGNGAVFVVRATDAQLDALATRLAGLYGQQVCAWFQYADNWDLLETAGFIVDTAVTGPEDLPVPRGWTLATAATKPVFWILHFETPWTASPDSPVMSALSGPDAETGPLARPAPIHLVADSSSATQAVARMTAAQARQVRRLAGVDWVGRVEAVLKLGLSVDATAPCPTGRAAGELMLRSAEARPNEQIELSVLLFGPSPALARAIAAAGGSVSAGGDNELIVKGPRRLIRWLARREDVRLIDLASLAGVGEVF